jgi:hypothetical protein
MNLMMSTRPVWAPDDDKGGGDGGGGGKTVIDQAALDAAAAAAAGADDKDKDDKGGADDKGAASFLDGADNLDDKGDSKKPQNFPDNWRDLMAADDAELRKALDRYDSPAAVAKANREAQTKLRSGKTVGDEPMPDPEKEPDKARDWRKARGIPDDPTGYAVPDTVKALVTDADKPRLAEFTEHMHKSNVPASAAAAALEYYFQADAAAKEAIAIADRADQDEVQEVLRGEWGPEFKANSTLAKRFAEEVTPGVNWFNARLPDGRVLGNIPDFVKSLADLARDKYGDVSFAGAEATQRTTARKEEIERMMVEEPQKYEGDTKVRAEYQAIIEAELKAAGKGGGSTHSPKMT